jgi:hypothetical protein
MRLSHIFILSLVSGLAHPADTGRPTGENCNLSAPPANAGEEMLHGITLKIYPRARDIIRSNYTGCQTTWIPENTKWLVLSVVDIQNGDAVRVWSPSAADPVRFSCTYKKGKVVSGDARNCAAAEYLIKKSLAPGCVASLTKTGGQFSPDCQYE